VLADLVHDSLTVLAEPWAMWPKSIRMDKNRVLWREAEVARMLTPAEVAARLRVDRETVYRHIRAGTILAARI